MGPDQAPLADVVGQILHQRAGVEVCALFGLDELGDDADFEALPEELKAQFAMALDSDEDVDIEKPVDMEALGLDLDRIDDIGEEAQVSDGDVPAVEADAECRD